jgi:hypothetical protein
MHQHTQSGGCGCNPLANAQEIAAGLNALAPRHEPRVPRGCGGRLQAGASRGRAPARPRPSPEVEHHTRAVGQRGAQLLQVGQRVAGLQGGDDALELKREGARGARGGGGRVMLRRRRQACRALGEDMLRPAHRPPNAPARLQKPSGPCRAPPPPPSPATRPAAAAPGSAAGTPRAPRRRSPQSTQRGRRPSGTRARGRCRGSPGWGARNPGWDGAQEAEGTRGQPRAGDGRR